MQCKTFSLRLNWIAAGHEHTHTFNCNWHIDTDRDSYKVYPQSRSTATVVSVSGFASIVVIIVIILCHISAISASQFAEFRAHLFLFGGCRLLSARGSNYWQHLARTSTPSCHNSFFSTTSALFLSKFAYLKLSKFGFAFCVISLWFLWFFLTYYRFNFPLPFLLFFSYFLSCFLPCLLLLHFAFTANQICKLFGFSF